MEVDHDDPTMNTTVQFYNCIPCTCMHIMHNLCDDGMAKHVMHTIKCTVVDSMHACAATLQ